jgi:hypothetical protein
MKRMEGRRPGWKDVGWIHLAPNTDKWQALVKKVIKLRVK